MVKGGKWTQGHSELSTFSASTAAAALKCFSQMTDMGCDHCRHDSQFPRNIRHGVMVTVGCVGTKLLLICSIIDPTVILPFN